MGSSVVQLRLQCQLLYRSGRGGGFLQGQCTKRDASGLLGQAVLQSLSGSCMAGKGVLNSLDLSFVIQALLRRTDFFQEQVHSAHLAG